MNLDACNSQTDLSMAKKHGKGSQLPQPSPFASNSKYTENDLTMSQGSLAGGYSLSDTMTFVRMGRTKGRPVATGY